MILFDKLVCTTLIFSVQNNIEFTDHENIPAYEGERACLARCGRLLAREENSVLLLIQATYRYKIKISNTSRSR